MGSRQTIYNVSGEMLAAFSVIFAGAICDALSPFQDSEEGGSCFLGGSVFTTSVHTHTSGFVL